MLKPILTMMVMAAALMAGTVGTALARISEPDVIYYGTALNAGEGGTVAITLTGAAVPLAFHTVGADRKYTLRVPMDALEPRLPGTARTGDAATITVDGVATALISDTGVVTADGSVVIPSRGTVVKFDLGTRTKEQWDKDHPGDNGSGDMNRNGITDLAEYLSGKDPASCVWNDVDIVHVETTVYHQAVLKNCLADAGMDLRHNVIRVARGTYAGNFSYVTAWGEAFDLSLVGGYDPAGGAGRTADPALTALTGDTDNDGAGNGVVLLIDTDTSKTPGTVHVESLTFRNGMAPAGQNGGGIQARIYQGSLELVGNIFRDNSADGGGGLSVDSSDSGQILLINNILYSNNAATAAAARISTAASGPVILLNNTFAGNTATSTDGYGRTLMVQSTAAAVDLTNNIIAGAGGAGSEIYIDSSGKTIPLVITHNAYDLESGLYVNTPDFVDDGSNIGAPPLFVAPATGNYRLGAASPCIDTGTAHAKMPAKDADGADRISGGGVDRGAYEFHDIVTNPATAVSGTGATLNGTVNANNANTTVSFEYGTTTSYGSSASAVPGTVTGSAATSVSAVITGLIPNTLYHFRVKGVNAGGTAYGQDVSFITQAPNWSLKVTIIGDGTVNRINPADFACSSGTCEKMLSDTTSVELKASPSGSSIFEMWTGNCSGSGTCTLTMITNKAVTAIFSFASAVKNNTTGTTYLSLAAALLESLPGDEIRTRDMELVGNVILDKGITLTGGWYPTFLGKSGLSTTLNGTLTVQSGASAVETMEVKGNLVIKGGSLKVNGVIVK